MWVAICLRKEQLAVSGDPDHSVQDFLFTVVIPIDSKMFEVS